MRRIWPSEFQSILNGAEEVVLNSDGDASGRPALKVRMTEEDYKRIWPLAEARYRLEGDWAGKAITLIANNPHYQNWHPVDGGTEDMKSDSGRIYSTKYVVVHFLLDDVRETVDS